MYGYSGQNSSSLYSTTDSSASSGGAFGLAGNPNIGLLFGSGGMGGQSWLVPALIAGAVAVSLLLLLRKRS